jgi:hypothetical protein
MTDRDETRETSERPSFIRRDPDGIEHDVTEGIERLLNPQNKVLRWTCECGRSWDMAMPGFPGGQLTHDGRHRHVARYSHEGQPYCDGRITATMIDFPIEDYRAVRAERLSQLEGLIDD